MEPIEYSFCRTYEGRIVPATISERNRNKLYLEKARDIAKLIYENNPELKETSYVDISIKARRA